MNHLITAFLAAGLLCAGSAGAQTQPPAPTQSTAPSAAAKAAAPPAQHLVVTVEGGNTTFKRPSWRQFTPLRFGTVLQAGDLLNLPVAASVTIVCDGFTTRALVGGPGIKPVPCAAAMPKPVWWRDAPILPTAQIDLPPSTDLNARLVPARTVDSSPSFEWAPIPGVDSYSVEILGDNYSWSGLTHTSKLEADARLEPDTRYEISVVPVSEKASASNGTTAKLFLRRPFTIVEPPAPAVLASAEKDLARLGLPAPVTAFLQARVFANAGSYDAAIRLLDELQTSLNVPARGRAIGEVYAAKGSLAEAEATLVAAAAVFEKDGDVFGRALTDEAIAAVQRRTPAKRAAAIERLRSALKTYQALGDTLDAARVDASIAALQFPILANYRTINLSPAAIKALEASAAGKK